MKTRAAGVLTAGALLFTIFLMLSHRAPFPADELAAVRHEEDIIVPVLERDTIRPIYGLNSLQQQPPSSTTTH